MSDPKPAGQGGDKKDKPELFKTRDGSPPKEDPPADDTPKGPKPDLLPNPYGTDDRPIPDIDIDKLPPLNKKRFKDDETPDDEDDILGGGPRGPGGDKGGPEVLASASSAGFDGTAQPTGESFSLNYEEISFDDMSGRPHALGAVDAVDGLPADASDSLNYEEIKVTIVAPETDQLGNFEIQDAMAAEPEGWSGSDGDD